MKAIRPIRITNTLSGKKELLETLAKLEKRTIDVEVVEVKHEDNATAD